RKFVHIGVGLWAIGTVLVFENWYFAIIPPLSFIVLNYISYRREVFKAMELEDKGNLGTVYFPISFALVIALCWARPAVIAAGLMPMTWGDAFASIVGVRWGRHRYTIGGTTRSLEGSAAMFLFSLVSVFLVLWGLGTPSGAAGLYALVVAVVATVVEALSVRGLDNITVPLVSVLVLWLLMGG
ncbi:MAG: hypothetical protein KKA73_20895, partial [Chloroflexi bacterium]|nr:hypothetical protein [Chloroflexota bacterium]